MSPVEEATRSRTGGQWKTFVDLGDGSGRFEKVEDCRAKRPRTGR